MRRSLFRYRKSVITDEQEHSVRLEDRFDRGRARLGLLPGIARPSFKSGSTSPSTRTVFSCRFSPLVLLLRNREAAASRARESARPLYWYGYTLLVVALACRAIAALLDFLPLDALSFVLCLSSMVMIVGGRSVLRWSWQSLVFLIFMIPLPYQVERMMGAELQHIATICTTFLLQTLGQPAIAEGNRILIQEVRLGVEDACSGLSMLMTFIAICVGAAMLLDRHWLVKALILASAVPIALLANILRITATGMVLVWIADLPTKDHIFHQAHTIFGHLMIVLGMTFLMLELWLYKHLLIEPEKATT